MANDAEESEKLFDACCDKGFFLLDLTTDDDGQELLDDVERAFETGKQFFAQDLEVKKEFMINSSSVGYKPMGVMKLKDGRTDLTEICGVSRDLIVNPRSVTIPQVYQRQRPQLQDLIGRIHPISMLILTHLARHLEVPPAKLEALHQLDLPSATMLRFLHTPPQKEQGSGQGKQASLLGHTDSGSLTILFNKIGGLQILPAEADEDDSAAWQWVRPEPGCAIVNIGDPLVQWTGGILRSAFHRVLYAPGAQASEHRYSFGYFLKPADEASMACLQEGRVIPATDQADAEKELPHYELWHRDKTKKIMKGHQDGVFRGGVRRTANPGTAVT